MLESCGSSTILRALPSQQPPGLSPSYSGGPGQGREDIRGFRVQSFGVEPVSGLRFPTPLGAREPGESGGSRLRTAQLSLPGHASAAAVPVRGLQRQGA